MAISLPRSLQKELHTVEKEVAHVKDLTPEERLHLVALVCQASLKILKLNPLQEKVLAMRDPLPESTIAALHRLRNEDESS